MVKRLIKKIVYVYEMNKHDSSDDSDSDEGFEFS